MKTHVRMIALFACLALAVSVSVAGQSPRAAPSLTCAEVLSSPTRDSVLLRVLLSVHAFDRKEDLPEAWQFDFGDAVRKHLVLPRPLGADVYESYGDSTTARTAHLTLRGNYSATLTADGRIINASTAGGANNIEFDNAILAAMRAVDSTDHLSPRDVGLPAKDVEIRVKIAAPDFTTTGGARALESLMVTAFTSSDFRPFEPHKKSDIPVFEPVPVDSESQMPLFSFRVPIRGVTQPIAEIPGVGGLRYPSNLLHAGVMGQVQASFVVAPEGLAEPGSVQFVYATRREFAESVLNAMPKFRYRPLEVNGCPVRTLTETPFRFYVAK